MGSYENGRTGAPDDLQQEFGTQAWLAVRNDPEAKVSGEYFYHKRLRSPLPATRETELQEQLPDAGKRSCGVELPA